MPYSRPNSHKPNFLLKVSDLLAPDVIQVTCLCGGGPWKIAPHWFYNRVSPYSSISDEIKALTCPRCGTPGVLAWTWLRAALKEGDPIPPPRPGPFGRNT